MLSQPSSRETEVLVVGAGPTGLLLAGDLAAAGVACTVVERRDGESNLTRAFAVHARTLELLDARGVADELVETGEPLGALRLFDKVEVDLSRLPTRFPFLLVTPQYETERVLEERAGGLGAQIVRGVQFVGLRQDADGVDVDVRAEDGSVQRRRAAFVVGADGVGSAVRRSLGLAFPGHSAVQSLMLADVQLTEAPPDLLTVNAVAEGFSFLAPFGDGWYRVIAWDRRRQLPDGAPVELDEIRDITRRALGTDYGMHDARWLSRFHSDERQVAHYRVDRVLLAGDAAHVHSPAGGQGMNTGLQDAANLGWKLAATVHGWAPAGLLDSYHAERHPVGQTVLRASGALLRLAMLRPRVLRAARRTLGGVLARTGPVARRVAGMVSGIAIAYPARRGEHRLAGRRAPDVVVGESRLYERLRAGRFVLLDRSGDDALARLADEGFADRVTVLRTPVAATTGWPAVTLIRPDAYVAWASDARAADERLSGGREALQRWCGPVAAATAAEIVEAPDLGDRTSSPSPPEPDGPWVSDGEEWR